MPVKDTKKKKEDRKTEKYLEREVIFSFIFSDLLHSYNIKTIYYETYCLSHNVTNSNNLPNLLTSVSIFYHWITILNIPPQAQEKWIRD